MLGGIQKLFKYLLKRQKKYLRENWECVLGKQLFFDRMKIRGDISSLEKISPFLISFTSTKQIFWLIQSFLPAFCKNKFNWKDCWH